MINLAVLSAVLGKLVCLSSTYIIPDYHLKILIIARIRVTMNNKKYPNLKPWQPGQSGNPAGRKVGSKNVSTIVSDLLEQDASEQLLNSNNIADLANGKPTSYAQAIVFAMLKKALTGNVQAACWLTEQQMLSYASESGQNGLFNASKLLVEIVPSKQSALD